MEASRKRENTTVTWILGIAKAQLLFWFTGTVLLLLFCWITWQMEDPGSVMQPLALVALCLSALAGGIGAVRFTGDGLLSGLVSGTVTVILLRLAALLPIPPSGLDKSTLLLFTCLLPVLSVCGAVLGKRRKKSVRRRRR